MRKRNWIRSAAVTAAFFVVGSSPALAVQIVLSPASAIGGSGSWNFASITNPWNVFGAQVGNVFDSQGPGPKLEDATPTGNAWLGNNGDTSEYFVLDLGASYVLQSFDLFNSHNGTFNDRSVQNFRIEAANAVAAPGSCETGAGTCGLDLSGPTAVLVGPGLGAVLALDLDPINAQGFAVTDTNAYRYLRFTMLSTYNAAGGGLNEMQVFGTPEPGALLLLGTGLAGLAAMGRKGRA